MTHALRSALPALVSALAALLLLGAGAALTVGGQASSTTCADDPAGDVVDEASGAAEQEPRADVQEFCIIEDGAAVTFSARTAEVLDAAAAADLRDTEGTYTAFGLDADGDGTAERVLVIGVEVGGALEGVVVERAGGSESCAGLPVQAEERTTSVTVSRACLGDPSTLRADVVTSLDPDGDFGEIAASVDRAPDDGFLTAGALAATPAPTSTSVTAPPAVPTATPSPTTDPVAATRTTDRLAGAGRIGTAIAVSRARFPDGAERAYLARADDLADAVAAGTLTDGPVLLVPTCGAAPAEVQEEIARLDPAEVVALGGTAAVCDQVLAGAAGDVPTDRIGGAGRIQTAALIARTSFPGTSADAFLARADVPVDAVAGGVLTGGPILLVPTCGDVPPEVTAELDRLQPERVAALGGTAAVCDQLLAAAAGGAGVPPDRLSGDDRFATAVAISRDEFADAERVYLARADDPADAVAGGSLVDGPVLVVPSCGALPDVVAAEIRRLDPSEVVALGGTAAVCDDLLAAARDV